MLDHLFLRFINSLKHSLNTSMLERAGLEEQLHHDLILGDISFETSFSLPGEANPPHIRADISLEWSAWSQGSYRSWSLGEGIEEPIEMVLEVALRFASLSALPSSIDELRSSLPHSSPIFLNGPLEIQRVTFENSRDIATDEVELSAEVVYEATVSLDEPVLEDPSILDGPTSELTGWIASILVKASDLPLNYLQL